MTRKRHKRLHPPPFAQRMRSPILYRDARTMTDVHPLTPLLAPSSVAIFGASNDPTRISGRSLRYYREAGYQGGLYPINPTRDTGQGSAGSPGLASVPGGVEWAVIAVPANLAIESMGACVAKGVK